MAIGRVHPACRSMADVAVEEIDIEDVDLDGPIDHDRPEVLNNRVLCEAV